MLLLTSFAVAMAPLVPFEETCRLAPVIVVAEVTSLEVRWNERGTLETWADLAVTSTFKGALPTDARIVTPGGALGGFRLDVEDTPTLLADHRYLLLLRARDAGGFAPFGGEAGVVPLGWLEDAATRLGGCHAR